MFGVEKYPDIDNMSCREARLWNGAVRMQSGKEGRIMGEGMQTGHRVFRGGNRIELEVTADKPFVIEQPGGSRQDGPVLPDPAAAPEGMAAEDVAARIAGARNQAQTDMLELARSQQNESERE